MALSIPPTAFSYSYSYLIILCTLDRAFHIAVVVVTYLLANVQICKPANYGSKHFSTNLSQSFGVHKYHWPARTVKDIVA